MNKRPGLALAIVLLIGSAGTLVWRGQAAPADASVTINGVTAPPVPALDSDEVALGRAVYARSCASCHGAGLEGVPDWKRIQPDGTLLPPPHDSRGHTWHHPDALLLRIVAEGGKPEDGNMPAFGGTLSEDEMHAVLTFIKTSWGQEEREFQWWITSTQDAFFEP